MVLLFLTQVHTHKECEGKNVDVNNRIHYAFCHMKRIKIKLPQNSKAQ